MLSTQGVAGTTSPEQDSLKMLTDIPATVLLIHSHQSEECRVACGIQSSEYSIIRMQ